MKIEDMVCSFEQAEKLVKLGLHLKSTYFYLSTTKELLPQKPIRAPGYPAYTTAELGILLPKIITVDEIKYFHSGSRMNNSGLFSMAYENDNQYLGTWMEVTEAQCRAECFICLLKNNYIKPENIKL